ncbi:uncharacterized protein KGF55_001606 [Candida pseudojiufengensis]|uniref:uncharacterized protein n=1 Tax=Candida pseudojiufengensis TaxID=497109 RepID=UPI002224A4CC|nr:uncharacterized protein KGF55_001606 [Candida pseudojiufengensis]KAI5965385.1 hypothetical protein KGF55_001606 [Candida pseudojiufengensis]
MDQPSKSTVDNDITSTINKIIDSIKSNSKKDIKIIKIDKDHSIKKSIDKILNQLSKSPVVVTGYANSIQKLISIVEIVKQKQKESKKVIHQYNLLQQYKTTFNPYKKSKHFNGVEIIDLSSQLKEKTTNDITKEIVKLNKEAEVEIKGEKEYKLPVLLVLLSTNDDIKSYLNEDWTIQQ